MIEKHRLKAENQGFGDQVEDFPRSRREPVNDNFETYMTAPVACDNRAIKGEPHEQKGSELVIPRKGRIEDIAVENAHADEQNHKHEQEH